MSLNKIEKKNTWLRTVDNRVLTVVEPEEVEILISSPNLVQVNLIRSLFFALKYTCSRVFPQVVKPQGVPSGANIGPGLLGSCCENSWRSGGSIKLQTWKRDLRRDIQRDRALFEWNSTLAEQKEDLVGHCLKIFCFQRKHLSQTKRGDH